MAEFRSIQVGSTNNIGMRQFPSSSPRPAAVDRGYSANYRRLVNSTIAAPVDWMEAVGDLRFPAKADQRLQDLMDRNTEGRLQDVEKVELEALVELSERLSLVRAEALLILRRRPE